MTRYIIIGTGVSGFSAAQTLRSLDPQADILLVSDDPYGYYSRPGLAYYLTGEIPEKQLFPFFKKGRLTLDVQRIDGPCNLHRPERTSDKNRHSRNPGV